MMQKRSSLLIGISVLVILAATAGMWNFYRNSLAQITESAGSMKKYSRHYLFVCDDDSEMWQSVYQYAGTAANASDAVLEWAGLNFPTKRSLLECMEIGISSKVDGIILEPDGTAEIRDAIQRAADQGIPVVNLIRDVEDSARISFVGASNSQLGELYGEQIVTFLSPGENRVCLLLDSANSETASNLLYSQVTRAVNGSLPEGAHVELYTRKVDSRNDFEAEEVIRNILLGEEAPDILICVNSVQTECARTALVDYNMVNKVKVIGYYASGQVLSALRNDLLPAAITCSAKQVGERAVAALDEYLNTGHVSDYFDITLEAVTSSDVNRYIRAQHHDGQTAGET